MQKNNYNELLSLIQTLDGIELKEALANYHESDIADALEALDYEARIKTYKSLGNDDKCLCLF